AASSGLASTATTSPACTADPARSGSTAMRPLISGWILISVARTMPSSGGSGRRSRVTTTPTATAASPSAIPMRLRDTASSARAAPQGEEEIDHRQGEDRQPVVRDLGEAGAHLIEPDDAVDPGFGREDVADRAHHRRDGLDRPRHAD